MTRDERQHVLLIDNDTGQESFGREHEGSGRNAHARRKPPDRAAPNATLDGYECADEYRTQREAAFDELGRDEVAGVVENSRRPGRNGRYVPFGQTHQIQTRHDETDADVV